MCGRYYEDEESIRFLRSFADCKKEQVFQKRDVTPAQSAAVLCREGNHIAVHNMVWGFPGLGRRALVINARAESAMEKKMFRDNILHRRCVIAARGFYEWSRSKEKYTFERIDSDGLFLAGCFGMYDSQERFVILTTEANPSVKPIHDRMPLILEREEIKQWLLDDHIIEHILHKTPIMLKRGTEYEQLTFF